RQQLEADAGGEEAAEGEEDEDGDQIEHRDPLVVLGEQPRGDAVVGVEVVAARAGGGGRGGRGGFDRWNGHASSFQEARSAAAGAVCATPCPVGAPFLSDLMY